MGLYDTITAETHELFDARLAALFDELTVDQVRQTRELVCGEWDGQASKVFNAVNAYISDRRDLDGRGIPRPAAHRQALAAARQVWAAANVPVDPAALAAAAARPRRWSVRDFYYYRKYGSLP